MFEFKSKKVNIFIKGEDDARWGLPIDAFCVDGCDVSGEVPCFLCNKAYEIIVFNKSREKLDIRVNDEERIKPFAAGNMLSGILSFERPCAVCIEIFISGELYARISFEATDNKNYKDDFKQFIKRTNQIIYAELAKADKSYEGFSENYKRAVSSIENLKKDTFSKAVNNVWFKKKNKEAKEKLKKRKAINENKRLFEFVKAYFYGRMKEKSGALYAIDENADGFCDMYLKECSQKEFLTYEKKLPKKIKKVVALVENLCGNYTRLSSFDIDKLYPFWCFLEMCEMLAKKYVPFKDNKVFCNEGKLEIDLDKQIQTVYIDSENDCEIILTYTFFERGAITALVKKRTSDAIVSKKCIFVPIYCKVVTEKEADIARRIREKILYEEKEHCLDSGLVVLCCTNCSSEIIETVEFSLSKTELMDEFFKKYFKRFIGGEKSGKDVCFIEPSGLENLEDIDISKKNMLVAVVKNSGQFYLNMEGNFYYIPEQFVENAEDIEFVAIYQSKHLFGDDYGIQYFGRVIKTEKVKRYNISEIPKNSDDMYYRFTLDGWEKLEHKIKPQGFSQVGIYTNIFLLENAKEYFELFFDKKEEYILYKTLNEILFKDDRCEKIFKFMDGLLIAAKDKLSIYNSENEKLILRKDAFLDKRLQFVKRIVSFLENK